jgi:hypothetical protein
MDVTEEGWIFIDRAEQQLQVPPVRWGSWPGLTRRQAVWLSDGSWLAGELSIAPGPRVEVESDWFQVPPVDLAIVRGIVVNPPASLHEWLRLQSQMVAAEGRQDVIWLMNNQRVSGVIRWPEGGKRPLDGQQLTLEGSNNQRVTIAWNDIQAIVLSPTLLGPVPASPAQSVGFVDGSLLHYDALKIGVWGTTTLQLPSGLELEGIAPKAEWLAAIRYLASRPGEVVFLSELEPASYRQASDNQLTWELGRDVDCYGKPLIIRMEEHAAPGIVPKGLAMHAPAQVAFRLEPTQRRFLAQATLALPDPQTTLRFGNVVCRVLVARNGKLEEVQQFSLSATAADQPQQLVDVDLTGAQLLVLLVEKGEFGSLGDHVLWLDARVANQ